MIKIHWILAKVLCTLAEKVDNIGLYFFDKAMQRYVKLAAKNTKEG